jgi:chromosome partitioning protein
MCEERTNLCKVITEEVNETFEGKIRIFESRIPSTVKVGESIYYSQPLLEYAPESRVCRAYLDFGRELIGYEG